MIPVNDLRRQLEADGNRVRSAIDAVIESGWLVLGPCVERFEQDFAAYVGVEHAVGVASGTDALILAMRAVGVRTGSEVVMAANAGGYAATAAHVIGARPVFADVTASGLLDTDAANSAVTPRTAAVVVTHLYGQAADVEALTSVLDGVPVIEDCAQAHGARTNGRSVGSLGDISAFSFYPTKNLAALGDAGAVLTSDAALADTVRALRTYGWAHKYDTVHRHGMNSRLDELQAAVLSVRLLELDERNTRRRQIATELLAASDGRLLASSDEAFVGHLCVLALNDRVVARDHFHAKGVATDVHYPTPDYLQPAWRDPDVSLPMTERLCRSVLTVPCFPELSDAEVETIAAAIKDLPI